MSTGELAVYAIRFAHRDASVRGEHFYGYEPCAAEPYPISYYVWLAVGDEHTVLVDAGFTPETSQRRGHRRYLQDPRDTIAALGVDPDAIGHLVLSHLHYDHVGHAAGFPGATLVVQEAELAFWTGRHAGRGQHPHLVEAGDTGYLVEQNIAGRMRLVDGEHEVVPGVTVHRVGGHTPGMQVVRIRTVAGHVVLASDASHFYENIEQDKPYAIVDHLPSMYDAFDTVRALADGDHLIVPGHDPRVLERNQPVAGLEGLAVRVA